MKHKLETRLPGEISIRYADDTTLMAESEEELKSLLMKVKVESEKVGLKLNIYMEFRKMVTITLCTRQRKRLYRSVLWTLWERERVGRFGRMALKHVKYHV